MPLDPGREWLASGITGIPRQREWDAVVLAEAPGEAGEEIEFVALPDGRLLVEGGRDAAPFAAALAGAIESPYRAIAVRRVDVWAVGARSIDVRRLDPAPEGDDIELVQAGGAVAMRIDGLPSTAGVPELERIGEARARTYVVRARRLEGALFEVEVEPL